MESERPDALFRDPYARKLTGEHGERVVARIDRGRATEQVAALAADLAAPPSFRWWLMDLASPRLLKMLAKTWGRAVAAGSAPFQFAPAEGSRFFQAQGWQEAEFRSMWEESLRLKRTMRLAWLWNLVGRLYPKAKREEFRRMSGIVLLRRA